MLEYSIVARLIGALYFQVVIPVSQNLKGILPNAMLIYQPVIGATQYSIRHANAAYHIHETCRLSGYRDQMLQYS